MKQTDTADLCEIAHTITAEICRKAYIKLDKLTNKKDETQYTKQAQDIFNRYFDLLDNTFRN